MMIIDALRVMLFGMAGIFMVMGVIILASKLLSLIKSSEEEQDD